MQQNPDNFVRHYLIAALWTATNGDDVGTPLDDTHTMDDFSPEAIKRAVDDCRKFKAENASDLEAAGSVEYNAHDFSMTRNGHGSGFFDRRYAKDVTDRLEASCQRFGEIHLYAGDDGKLYFE